MNRASLLLAETISQGLVRGTLTRASRWASQFYVMPANPVMKQGPLNFKYYPWEKDMLDSNAPLNVGQKAAQMGYSNVVLGRTFYEIDVKGTNCLYVLPAKTPDASDFSSSRFDPALELSPHLANLFSDVKNVGHKRAGSANLFIRGSRSRSGLKSIPAGLIILDELEEMTQENIPLALERASGQFEKFVWMISTPWIDNKGINTFFNQSTMEHFWFPCPCCSKYIELKYPESLVVTGESLNEPKLKNSHLICYECKNKLPHDKENPNVKASWLYLPSATTSMKGAKWIPNRTNIDSRGFHVSQLYSATVSPYELACAVIKARYSPADEQELYNSKLGLPRTPEGSSVTDTQIEECKGGYLHFKGSPPNGIICMGVDVGKWLHIEICAYFLPPNFQPALDLNVQCQAKQLISLKVKDFSDLDLLIKQYNVNMCVIDANPERRHAYEFACRNYGKVKLCQYPEGISNRQLSENVAEQLVSADRTSWLDMSLGRFKTKAIKLPIDCSDEYKEQIKAQVRIFRKDKNGQQIARYETADNVADHFGHARNYCEIALPLAMSVGRMLTERVG